MQYDNCPCLYKYIQSHSNHVKFNYHHDHTFELDEKASHNLSRVTLSRTLILFLQKFCWDNNNVIISTVRNVSNTSGMLRVCVCFVSFFVWLLLFSFLSPNTDQELAPVHNISTLLSSQVWQKLTAVLIHQKLITLVTVPCFLRIIQL